MPSSSPSSSARRADEPAHAHAAPAAVPAGSAVSASGAASERRSAARQLVAAVRLPAAGGSTADPLAAILAPRAGDRRRLWIGTSPPGVDGFIQAGGAAHRSVELSPEEQRSCDDGLVQHALWPLFHDMAPLAHFDGADWQAFRSINRKFARAVAQVLARGSGDDLLWVHDPRLMGLAAALRRRHRTAAATFFLRLPFPPLESFLRLPWRRSLLGGLLAFRRVGFQTRRDLGNFLDAVGLVFPAITTHPRGSGWEIEGQHGAWSCACTAGVHPEGVDAAAIAQAAASPEVARQAALLHAALAGEPGGKIVLALDTLDPAQGTVHKLRAFAAALDRQPALRASATLVLRLAPSSLAACPATAAARELRREVERTVGEINGRLGSAGRVPVHYRFGEPAEAERLALLHAADVALATPLRAGMELTAKAYCAASDGERGILILSELSGAATQLAGARLVNPLDVEATARILVGALRGAGSGERRRWRMRELRAEVHRHDLGWWMRELLPALAEPGDGEPR